MTDATNTLAPTDAQIDAIADQHKASGHGTVWPHAFARAVLAKWGAPAQAAPSTSVEQEAMQMLWNDQQQEEKEHYRDVARGAELPLYAIRHPEDIDKTKRRAAPEQPAAPANVDSAPLHLNLNDLAMWVLGWNACLDKAHAAQKAAAQAVHVDAARLDWLERCGH